MANLFTKKLNNKKVETSVGDFYVKPLPMSMLGWANKLSDLNTAPAEQAVAFAMVLKAVAVDADGNKLDDIEAMSANELAEAFPAEDLLSIVEAIMPAPQGATAAGNGS